MAERKPWKYIGMEDVTVTRFRQHIRESQYWADRAKEDDGRDSSKYDICQAKTLAFMVALGEVLRTRRWVAEGSPKNRDRIPYFAEMVNPDGEAAHSLWLAGEYLQMVKENGRDAVIMGSDPFDPAAAFEGQKTWY